MSVTLNDKKQTVEGLVEILKDASAVYLLNYQGITVGDDNTFRKELNRKAISYKSAKNTLLKRALAEVGIEGLDSYLTGTTSVAVGDSEDPMAPAKEIVAFLKENKDVFEPKAISLDGQVMSGDKVGEVAKMPGRKELIASIVSIAMGPGANLVAIMKGPSSNVAGAVKALEEKLND